MTHAEAFRRVARVTVFDREVPMATAEDLILYKIISHRRKDLAHVEDIVRRQRGKLDAEYLRQWADRIAAATGRFEVPSTLEKMLSE